MIRRTLLPTLLAATLLMTAGCASQLTLGASAARPGATQGVRAVLATGATGTVVTLNDPTLLPEAVRNAPTLKAVVSGTAVPVTRNPGGSFTFVIPANVATHPDVNGDLEVVFVMNDTDSQIVLLATGSPVQFDTPPVTTDPNPGFVVQGLDVMLHANSSADTTRYQFTWSYGTTAQGPWQAIPGQGKDVKWTPPAPGNYYIKVDAVDRQTQQEYSTTTSSAVVFVTDAKEVLTTTPTSGSIQRGDSVTLKFNTPAGLTGTNLAYAWSYGLSPQGPWTTITGSGPQISWLPTDVGSYYIKAEVSNEDTGTVNTFISPQAIVFVGESKPIITADHPLVNRGDRVNFTLNIANPGKGPFAWYIARSSATGGASSLAASSGFVPLQGTGTSISTVATDAGTFNLRVDIPQADGSVKSFVTANPVLNVQEPSPVVHTDPPFESITPGDSASLVLDASGVDETNFHYIWYLSSNPTLGFSALPFDAGNNQHAKRYTITGLTSARFASGSYYARVDAISNDGLTTYSFVSSSPVITLSNAAVR